MYRVDEQARVLAAFLSTRRRRPDHPARTGCSLRSHELAARRLRPPRPRAAAGHRSSPAADPGGGHRARLPRRDGLARAAVGDLRPGLGLARGDDDLRGGPGRPAAAREGDSRAPVLQLRAARRGGDGAPRLRLHRPARAHRLRRRDLLVGGGRPGRAARWSGRSTRWCRSGSPPTGPSSSPVTWAATSPGRTGSHCRARRDLSEAVPARHGLDEGELPGQHGDRLQLPLRVRHRRHVAAETLFPESQGGCAAEPADVAQQFGPAHPEYRAFP